VAIRVALVGSLLMVLFAVPAPAVGQESTRASEQLEGQPGDILGDRALWADYFRAMALSARAEMRLHKYMARSFHSGKKRAQLGARHCEKLVEQYRAIAEEYDALARLHDEESREAR
jgi:hypothetical protein